MTAAAAGLEPRPALIFYPERHVEGAPGSGQVRRFPPCSVRGLGHGFASGFAQADLDASP